MLCLKRKIAPQSEHSQKIVVSLMQQGTLTEISTLWFCFLLQMFLTENFVIVVLFCELMRVLFVKSYLKTFSA